MIIAIGDEDSGKNKRIEQTVIFTTENNKFNQLIRILSDIEDSDKVIVFVNAKKVADVLVRNLESRGYSSGIHPRFHPL